MTLLSTVVAHLRAESIAHAIIGAAALSAHGVSRATADVDLLTTDRRALAPDTWTAVADLCKVDVRRGNHEDPLAGVVRFTSQGELDVDIVVGKHTWQDGCVTRAAPSTVEQIPVVGLADLVLLKLYAGGPQDGWDIQQILNISKDAELVATVNGHLSLLPGAATTLWQKILGER